MSDERRTPDASRFRSLSESDAWDRQSSTAYPSAATERVNSDLGQHRESADAVGAMPSTVAAMNHVWSFRRALTTDNVRRRLTFDSYAMDSSTSRSEPYISGRSDDEDDDDDIRERSRLSAQQLLRELANDLKRQQEDRWNFNFESCRPHHGRYEWWPVDGVASDGRADLAERSPSSTAACFVPIDRRRRCRADECREATESWRPTTTMANAQTQTRPEVDLLRVVGSLVALAPEAVVDQNNNDGGGSLADDEVTPMHIDEPMRFEADVVDRTENRRRLHSSRRRTGVTSSRRITRRLRLTSSIKRKFRVNVPSKAVNY